MAMFLDVGSFTFHVDPIFYFDQLQPFLRYLSSKCSLNAMTLGRSWQSPQVGLEACVAPIPFMIKSWRMRLDRNSIALVSRWKSAPVCRARWKVAFRWSAWRANRILLWESMRAYNKKHVSYYSNSLVTVSKRTHFRTHTCDITTERFRIGEPCNWLGGIHWTVSGNMMEFLFKQIICTTHTCIWFSMINAASSFSRPATLVLNALAIVLRSTEMNGFVYWISALCLTCSYKASTWS